MRVLRTRILFRLAMPLLRYLAQSKGDSAKADLWHLLTQAHDTPEVRELKALFK